MKVNLNKNSTASFTGIYNSRLLHKGLKFAAENGSLFSATVTLGLSTVARPIAILSTPNTDKENKEYACAKSFASSTAGYLLTAAAAAPVARAVKNIDQNPAKFLKEKTIKNLQQGEKCLKNSKKYQFATQLFKLGLGFLIAVPKSVMTCALIPPIMNKIFGKNLAEKSTKNENKNGKNIPFKGVYQKGTEKLSKGFGRIIDSDFIQKISEKFSNSNYEQHIISMTDVLLTGTFIHQTNKSKKIDEDRKKSLIYNAGISTGLSIAGGYALNRILKKPGEKFIENFKKANKNLPDLEKYIEGIKVAKTVLILGGIYYIIIPLLSTFFADRVGKNPQHKTR